MAINFPNGFYITSQEPIDARIILTKAEMKAQLDARMPDVYLAICKDDGKVYLYNKDNEVDPDLGKFRLQEAEISEDGLALKLPGALAKAIAKQEEPSGLTVDSEGNIKVSLDSDFLEIGPDNHITFSDFIIESGE